MKAGFLLSAKILRLDNTGAYVYNGKYTTRIQSGR